MRKLLTIAQKDIYTTFTDRALLVIMIATPLLLSTIIGLAFSGLGGDQQSFSQIPIAVVNADAGSTINGQALNFGETFTAIVTVETATNGDTTLTGDNQCDLFADEASDDTSSQAQGSLQELLGVTVLDDAATARQGVDDGTYVAAILIPAEFTAQLAPTVDGSDASIGQTSLEIYASDASPVSANIVRSVTESLVQPFVTGNVTIAATIAQLTERAQANPVFGAQFGVAGLTGNFQPDFNCAFLPGVGNLSVASQPLTATQEESQFVQLLIAFGTAQAVFFALFTAQQGLLSIYEERDNWTLQRLVMSPTPRLTVLIGKVLGSVLVVFLQIAVLIVALTLVASLIEGELLFIWGSNIALIALTVICVTVAVSGVGMLLVGIARTPQQANSLGSMLNIALAVLGGAFGFSLPQSVAQFSLIYWGVDALQAISNGSSDIALNLLVLVVQGVLMFSIGAWLFSRREIV